jgi:type IV pilus assembly protein PilA
MESNKMKTEGFSLVELMITVGIIGITTAIAVPSYLERQARGRQTEAKINLATIYTDEKTYSIQANGYTACLSNIGFTPENDRYYAIGFKSISGNCGTNKAGTSIKCSEYLEYPNASGTTCSSSYYTAEILAKAAVGTTPAIPAADATYICPATRKTSSSVNNLDLVKANLPDTILNSTNFKAGAAGNIRSKAQYDKWTIDQDMNLINQ